MRAQINPGEVKVLKGRSNIVLYSDGSGSENPYQGNLRVKIEPTRLSVKLEPVEHQHVPSSPSSSHAGSVNNMAGDGGYGSFRPPGGGGASQSCSSQGQSPTES